MTSRLERLVEQVESLGEESPQGGTTPVDALLATAHVLIDGALAVTVTSLRRGSFVTTAASSDLGLRADLLQYGIGSGPCLDAALGRGQSVPHDLAHDERWPEFRHRLSEELGINSCLSYQVPTSRYRHSLNVYGRRPEAFSCEDMQTGFLCAGRMAITLGLEETRHEVSTLKEALVTTREIGIAVGVIMTQHKLSRKNAFDVLKRASQDTNRKLNELATIVADTGALPPSSVVRPH